MFNLYVILVRKKCFSFKKNYLIIPRLPTSSGEKVTLGLTCFVAFSVFMLMVAEKVPATSDTVPIIGKHLFHIKYIDFYS
jgi:hypothetical protein